DSGPKPRCLVTNLQLPNYINHDAPPKKKKPFSIILNQLHSHTLELLVPATCAEVLQQHLSSAKETGLLHYAKIHLKLLDIISGDFFTEYIQSPGGENTNLSMLSEGRPGIDEVYRFHRGKLSIEVDKPTFERVGLQGNVIPSRGRKHVEQRYLIEIDLRSPRMVDGKKGFERMKRAFENVLNETKTWLVVDLENSGALEGGGAMKGFAPLFKQVEATVEKVKEALVPAWPEEVKEEDYVEAAELLEWIGLAMMGSPRIEKGDDVDPYLCRYQVPTAFGETTTQDLVRLRWRGPIYPAFAQRLFLAALK
ncbi:uncharacterized protein MYCFIDRAFT_99560, partial [Pseudocercospora fijiensis CIRAD86]